MQLTLYSIGLREEDNVKMNLKEIGIYTRNWIDSAQDRDYWRALVNAPLDLHGHVVT